jgi:hypothetical protein
MAYRHRPPYLGEVFDVLDRLSMRVTGQVTWGRILAGSEIR